MVFLPWSTSKFFLSAAKPGAQNSSDFNISSRKCDDAIVYYYYLLSRSLSSLSGGGYRVSVICLYVTHVFSPSSENQEVLGALHIQYIRY